VKSNVGYMVVVTFVIQNETKADIKEALSMATSSESRSLNLANFNLVEYRYSFHLPSLVMFL